MFSKANTLKSDLQMTVKVLPQRSIFQKKWWCSLVRFFKRTINRVFFWKKHTPGKRFTQPHQLRQLSTVIVPSNLSCFFSERDKGNLHGNCQKSLETLRIFCFISGYQIECEKKSFLSVWVGPFTQSWFFFERQLVRYAQAHARTWCISTVVCHCKRQTTNEMEGFCEVSFLSYHLLILKAKKFLVLGFLMPRGLL